MKKTLMFHSQEGDRQAIDFPGPVLMSFIQIFRDDV